MGTSNNESQTDGPDHDEAEVMSEAQQAAESAAEATEPGTEPPRSELVELGRRLDSIQHVLDDLQGHVVERLRYDAAKEKAFDRLYAQLDEERKQGAGESLKPILRDLTLLYDHIVEAARQAPEESQTLDVIREGLLEVLYRADVERLVAGTDRFDRSIQYAARVVAAENDEQDWTVAEVLKEGFSFRGTTLRPQHVVVRRLRSQTGPPDSIG